MIQEFALPKIYREHPLLGVLDLATSVVDGTHIWLLKKSLGRLDAIDSDSILKPFCKLNVVDNNKTYTYNMICLGFWQGFKVFKAEDNHNVVMMEDTGEVIIRFDGGIGLPNSEILTINGRDVLFGVEYYIGEFNVKYLQDTDTTYTFPTSEFGSKTITLTCFSNNNFNSWTKNNEYNYLGFGNNRGKNLRLGYGQWSCDNKVYKEEIPDNAVNIIQIEGLNFDSDKNIYTLGSVDSIEGWWEVFASEVKAEHDFTMKFVKPENSEAPNLEDKRFAWYGFFTKKCKAKILLADTPCWR